jgi:hypothetical protein
MTLPLPLLPIPLPPVFRVRVRLAKSEFSPHACVCTIPPFVLLPLALVSPSSLRSSTWSSSRFRLFPLGVCIRPASVSAPSESEISITLLLLLVLVPASPVDRLSSGFARFLPFPAPFSFCELFLFSDEDTGVEWMSGGGGGCAYKIVHCFAVRSCCSRLRMNSVAIDGTNAEWISRSIYGRSGGGIYPVDLLQTHVKGRI